MWRLFGRADHLRDLYCWERLLSEGPPVVSRIARIVALALPVLLVCILVTSGGWRVHDGRVERVGHVTTAAPPPASAAVPDGGPIDGSTFAHHLSPSVPWPAWVGLIVLCLLPAVGSMAAWSGARRRRDSAYAATGGAS
jgi:hypothetical protein